MEIVVASVLALALAVPAATGWIFLAYALWDVRRDSTNINGAVAFAAIALVAFLALMGVGFLFGGSPSAAATAPPVSGMVAGSLSGVVAGSFIVVFIVGVSTNDDSSWDGISRPIVAGVLASYVMSWIIVWTGFPQ